KCVTWRPESRCSYGGDTRMRRIVLSILATGNGLDRPRRGTLAHPWGCPRPQGDLPERLSRLEAKGGSPVSIPGSLPVRPGVTGGPRAVPALRLEPSPWRLTKLALLGTHRLPALNAFSSFDSFCHRGESSHCSATGPHQPGK